MNYSTARGNVSTLFAVEIFLPAAHPFPYKLHRLACLYGGNRFEKREKNDAKGENISESLVQGGSYVYNKEDKIAFNSVEALQ